MAPYYASPPCVLYRWLGTYLALWLCLGTYPALVSWAILALWRGEGVGGVPALVGAVVRLLLLAALYDGPSCPLGRRCRRRLSAPPGTRGCNKTTVYIYIALALYGVIVVPSPTSLRLLIYFTPR